MDKKSFRKEQRKKSNLLSKEYINMASEGIYNNVFDLPDFALANCIFIFISTENEPQTRKIVEKAWEFGKTVCVPKCITDCEMIAAKINSFEELSLSDMGLLEPKSTENVIGKEKIDIAFIPCVCADKAGNRMGHGAGYYDRFLKDTDFKKACICFDKMLCNYVPTDENDIVMDFIITETAVFYANTF